MTSLALKCFEKVAVQITIVQFGSGKFNDDGVGRRLQGFSASCSKLGGVGTGSFDYFLIRRKFTDALAGVP